MQLGFNRPNIECSTSKTPIEGLYLCGASTYPGGMVTGGPGYIAANKVAEDMGLKKWWKPTWLNSRCRGSYETRFRPTNTMALRPDGLTSIPSVCCGSDRNPDVWLLMKSKIGLTVTLC